MKEKYQIGKDGLIFEIKEDGTINRIGKIGSSGKLENIKSSSNFYLWTFLIISIVICIILALNLSAISNIEKEKFSLQNKKMNEELHIQKAKVFQLESQVADIKKQMSNLEKFLPFKIDRIEIGNVRDDGSIIDNFGSILYNGNIILL